VDGVFVDDNDESAEDAIEMQLRRLIDYHKKIKAQLDAGASEHFEEEEETEWENSEYHFAFRR
jgi:hypothetical protein